MSETPTAPRRSGLRHQERPRLHPRPGPDPVRRSGARRRPPAGGRSPGRSASAPLPSARHCGASSRRAWSTWTRTGTRGSGHWTPPRRATCWRCAAASTPWPRPWPRSAGRDRRSTISRTRLDGLEALPANPSTSPAGEPPAVPRGHPPGLAQRPAGRDARRTLGQDRPLPPARPRGGRSDEERDARATEHRLLFEAVRDGDAATAADLMRHHVETSLGARSAVELAEPEAVPGSSGGPVKAAGGSAFGGAGRRLLGLLLLHSALTQVVTFVLRPTTAYRAIELDVPAAWLGVLTASFAVVPLLLAVPSGQATDRFGERTGDAGRLGADRCVRCGLPDRGARRRRAGARQRRAGHRPSVLRGRPAGRRREHGRARHGSTPRSATTRSRRPWGRPPARAVITLLGGRRAIPDTGLIFAVATGLGVSAGGVHGPPPPAEAGPGRDGGARGRDAHAAPPSRAGAGAADQLRRAVGGRHHPRLPAGPGRRPRPGGRLRRASC